MFTWDAHMITTYLLTLQVLQKLCFLFISTEIPADTGNTITPLDRARFQLLNLNLWVTIIVVGYESSSKIRSSRLGFILSHIEVN